MAHGRYTAQFTQDPQHIEDAQRFRACCFDVPVACDRDLFDPRCLHVLIRDSHSGAIVCCYRLMPLRGAQIERSYSAQYYNLAPLKVFPGLLLEMGRFCIDPARKEPDILRLAWAAMTAYVDASDVTLLFGCSSFRGTDPARYSAAFAQLHARALAPSRWRPIRRAKEIVCFADQQGAAQADTQVTSQGMAQIPPLLRSYLGMGGWVSDHVVIDRAMNTLHVFTGVETARIPPARKRLLRALSQQGALQMPEAMPKGD